jgi:hypothetical protein
MNKSLIEVGSIWVLKHFELYDKNTPKYLLILSIDSTEAGYSGRYRYLNSNRTGFYNSDAVLTNFKRIGKLLYE